MEVDDEHVEHVKLTRDVEAQTQLSALNFDQYEINGQCLQNELVKLKEINRAKRIVLA